MTSGPAVDEGLLAQLVADTDAGTAVRLALGTAAEIAVRGQAIAVALADGDIDRIGREAHILSSLAATFGLHDLSHLARTVDEAHRGAAGGVRGLARDLPAMATAAAHALASAPEMVGRLEAAGTLVRLRDRPLPAGSRRAVLFLEVLALGGAERQLCELAVGLTDLGWEVEVLLRKPVPEAAGHYLSRLRDSGIGCTLIPAPDMKAMAAEAAEVLALMPPYLAPIMAGLATALADRRPGLLVCYLDRPNLIGAVAGILAGIPAILMSGRNVAPFRLDHLFPGQVEDFRWLYRSLAPLPGVVLSVNSAAGARSYAEWLDWPAPIPVIPNCVAQEVLAPLPADQPARIREMLGIPADAPLILGVFRLSPEKRPGLFIEVVGRLKRQRPDLFALICGAGELTEAERSLMAAHGLGDRLLIRGDLGDLRAVMRTAALLLHVALHEGQPNAVLEAQALDLPVVSVRTGGTLEVLAPCLRPFSPPGDDPDDLVKACLSLLDDPGHARSLGIEAGVDVRARHRLDAMTAATLAAAGR